MLIFIKFLFLFAESWCIYHCLKDLSLLIRKPAYRGICPVIVPILYIIVMVGLMFLTVGF